MPVCDSTRAFTGRCGWIVVKVCRISGQEGQNSRLRQTCWIIFRTKHITFNPYKQKARSAAMALISVENIDENGMIWVSGPVWTVIPRDAPFKTALQLSFIIILKVEIVDWKLRIFENDSSHSFKVIHPIESPARTQKNLPCIPYSKSSEHI